MVRMDKIFKLLAVRVLAPTAAEVNNTIRTTIVQSMQKSMSGYEKWHYFCNGVLVDRDGVVIPQHSLDEQMLYKGQETNISIGAIVGKNGAGKSTLVDLAIRMMNNVAACVFGEYPRFAAAEHLHFIDYVFAELLYLRDGIVYRLTMRNRQVILHQYKRVQSEKGLHYFREVEAPIEFLKSKNDVTIPLIPQNDAQVLADHFFYSVVCNYSFYAYNYRDYAYEQTNDKRILAITEGVVPKKNEEKFWISGLFHKNDGYQTPVVLNPWRKDGNLDVAKENDLAMERIISLLFYYDPINNQYPFWTILDKLMVNYIKFPEKDQKVYARVNMVHSLFGNSKDYDVLQKNLDEWLYDLIVEKWRETYHIGEIKDEQIDIDARDYAVYKTLKICSHYIAYLDIMKEMMKEGADRERIRGLLGKLGEDRTHITSKLRRACFQLRYRFYQYQNDITTAGETLIRIDRWMKTTISEQTKLNEGFQLEVDDLLPPPLFDFNLGIQDRYGKVVPFTGLSTGERQVTYVISNMMYHLVNINSAWKDKGKSHEVRYRYVNIMLDEVELYFHPDLQRRFVDMTLSALRSVSLPEIYGVNITLVPHSPFVVSDLPDTSIMYLGKKQDEEGTFGANIYNLLDNTFFMDDNIGELAKKRIGQLVSLYNVQTEHWKYEDDSNEERTVCKDAFENFAGNWYFYSYLCSIVGDEYLKRELNDMFKELYDFYHEKGLMS